MVKSLLKKQNWFWYALLAVLSQGVLTFVLASDLELYDSNAWYSKWYYWVGGAVVLVLPALIMVVVWNITMQIEICKKLHVKGEKIYALPYPWILCMIVPIIGWAIFIVMLIHIYIYPSVMIYQGEGEKLL